MTDDDQRVDPRYDPAFQRGFDGQVTPGVRTGNAIRRPSLVSPTPEPEADAEVESPAEPEPASDPVEVSTSGTRDPRRNPFLITLVVLGSALTIGGIAWAYQGRQMVAELSTELDYWFLQASVAGAPLTTLTGIAILAGVLFVAAGAWNRRS